MKNVLDEFINRLNTAEERISGLKEKLTENSKTEIKEEKNNEKEKNIQELWDYYKRCDMYIMKQQGEKEQNT